MQVNLSGKCGSIRILFTEGLLFFIKTSLVLIKTIMQNAMRIIF